MSERNDGGPAFPVASTGHLDYASICGMSLRDYFAAAATEDDIECYLPDTMGDVLILAVKRGMNPDELSHNEIIAELRTAARYKHADAMIRERERKPNA